MATPDKKDTSEMLNGNGVGVALAAIFVGVAVAVAFIASDGAIFGHFFQPAPGDTGSANGSSTSHAETQNPSVISRDVFDQGSSDENVSESVAQSDAGRTGALQGEEKNGSAMSAEQRQLLAMKSFPWNSVAKEQIFSSQNIINKFKQQNMAQQESALPRLESLLLSDEVSVDVDRDRVDNEADEDRAPANSIDIFPIDIREIDDDGQEQQDEEEAPDTSDAPEDQQDDSANNDDQVSEEDSTSNEGELPDDDNSGSGSEDDEEQSGDNGSNSTGTQGPSEDSSESESDDGGNSTGTEVIVSFE